MQEKPTLLPPTIRDLNENLLKHGHEYGLNKWARTSWAEDLDIPLVQEDNKEVLFFVGCAESADDRDKKVARAMVSVLRKAGIDFGILGQEEVCASDASLQTGETDLFEELARINIDNFKKYGVKRIITTSPHVYHVIKNEYPRFGGDFEVLHYIQLLEELLEKGSIKFAGELEQVVTYHDPCRLGRLSGIYDAPRKLIEAIPGLELKEMPRSRENALCCGTTGWMNCSSCSKAIQVERLAEASDTGAGTLVTACPKCQIHFRCAKSAFDLEIEITDLYDMVADRIKTNHES